MSSEIIHILCMLGGVLFIVIFLVILFFLIRGICKGLKNFLFELIDHINGTTSSNVTPKQKQDTTPPWEQ